MKKTFRGVIITYRSPDGNTGYQRFRAYTSDRTAAFSTAISGFTSMRGDKYAIMAIEEYDHEDN